MTKYKKESEFTKEELDILYKQGVDAYHTDVDMTDNPYPILSVNFKYWDKGWWETFYNETSYFIETFKALNASIWNPTPPVEPRVSATIIDFAAERRNRQNNEQRKNNPDM